jgi:photosystem II stability/assembly factor-like uncharacterized protein
LGFELASLVPDFRLISYKSTAYANRALRGGGGPWIDARAPHAQPLHMHRLLSDRSPAISIRWLDVDANDSNRVLAATEDGLFESSDAGASWVRSFDDPKEVRRHIQHVVRSAFHKKTRYLATQYGLLVSRDGGISYQVSDHPLVSRVPIYWIEEDPRRSDTLWVGTQLGAWVSEDGGKTFRLGHWVRVPGQQTIRRVAFHPRNAESLLLVSDDVIFVSDDGGQTFRVCGVYAFSGQQLVFGIYGRSPNHIIATTAQDIWESFDAGETWQIVIFGNLEWRIVRSYRPTDDSDLWILTRGEIMKLVERTSAPESSREVSELERLVEREPRLEDVVSRGLEVNRVLRSDLSRKRRRSTWSHILPLLQIDARRRHIDLGYQTANLSFGGFSPSGDDWDPALETFGRFDNWHVQVMANWDLHELIAARDELPIGRVFEENDELAEEIRETLIALYTERRRLQIQTALDPNVDLRRTILRQMRVRELTSLLNLLTDDIFVF